MGYFANFGELYRDTAVYIDKILKGAKPANLPVSFPSVAIKGIADIGEALLPRRSDANDPEQASRGQITWCRLSRICLDELPVFSSRSAGCWRPQNRGKRGPLPAADGGRGDTQRAESAPPPNP